MRRMEGTADVSKMSSGIRGVKLPGIVTEVDRIKKKGTKNLLDLLLR
jgi:hypothetical protein